VVLAAGGPLTPDLLTPPGAGERPWRPLRARGGDLQGLVQQLVRLGIQTLPDGTLDKQIVGAVERELIEQVMEQCGGTQVTAARRLGINRNTLYKKVTDYRKADANGDAPPGDAPAP
jgi:transcriptional regulator with AAA-type ATPase domain